MDKTQVKKWFEEAVRLDLTAPQELKEALLKGHPNLDGFITKMTLQIQQAQLINFKRRRPVSQKTLQDFVYDMTKYFMQGMQGEAEKRYESDLKRAAREAEEQKIAEFESVLSGKAEGEFAEAGVITNEKIDQKREAELEAQDKAQTPQR